MSGDVLAMLQSNRGWKGYTLGSVEIQLGSMQIGPRPKYVTTHCDVMPARICGALAITQTNSTYPRHAGYPWTVTHVPSGFACGMFKSAAGARRAVAAYLALGVDWSRKTPVRPMTPALALSLTAIITEHGGIR